MFCFVVFTLFELGWVLVGWLGFFRGGIGDIFSEKHRYMFFYLKSNLSGWRVLFN